MRTDDGNVDPAAGGPAAAAPPGADPAEQPAEQRASAGGGVTERPIIKFTINLSWDAQPHVAFFYAPDGWDTMTPAERVAFCEEEAETYEQEVVERSYTMYDTEAQAEKDDHGWGAYYTDPEDRW